MIEDPSLESFTAKWRSRWPEWAIAEAFVPPSQREVAVAWFALLQELMDAAWAGGDPAPGIAKLAWWREELRGWSRGRRRHPLGIALQRQAAPWPVLEAALDDLRNNRDPPSGARTALKSLQAFASAASKIEEALFASADDTDAIAACLLSCHPQWMAEAGRHADLLALWPRGWGSRPRRIATALARGRVRKGAWPPAALPPWSTLWLAWRAARH